MFSKERSFYKKLQKFPEDLAKFEGFGFTTYIHVDILDAYEPREIIRRFALFRNNDGTLGAEEIAHNELSALFFDIERLKAFSVELQTTGHYGDPVLDNVQTKDFHK